MIKSVLRIAAFFAVAASLLVPAEVGARGFAGHFGRGFHLHHGFWPYRGPVATYSLGAPVQAVPAQVEPVDAVTPRCTHSVETVTVPSEDGGTRQITITRC